MRRVRRRTVDSPHSPAGSSPRSGAPPNTLWGNTQSTAGDEVTVEHLIVGVLLFTPLLALVPTVIMWYLYASVLHGVVVASRMVVCALGYMVLYNPGYMVMRRAIAPNLFPGTVQLQQGVLLSALC